MEHNDRRWEARIWLSRAWEKDDELRSYERRKDEIISQLSGIGKYDSEFIPSQKDENSVENKNIEYSQLCAKIEQVIRDISIMNARSLEVISKVKNAKTRAMLYDRFINRMTWKQIGDKYHYAKAQPYRYVGKGLDEARRYITEEEIKEACYA